MGNGFLLSTAWAKIRTDIIILRGGKCERCTREGTQVHHLCYDRYGGNEEPEDLILLCSYHHRLEHNLVKPTRKDKRIISGKKKKKKNKVKVHQPEKAKLKMSISELRKKAYEMDIKS